MFHDSTFLWAETPDWISYDGMFHVEFRCKGAYESLNKKYSFIQEIKKLVEAKYPGEKFTVDFSYVFVGGNRDKNEADSDQSYIGVVIRCNKSLFSKFDAQPIKSIYIAPRSVEEMQVEFKLNTDEYSFKWLTNEARLTSVYKK